MSYLARAHPSVEQDRNANAIPDQGLRGYQTSLFLRSEHVEHPRGPALRIADPRHRVAVDSAFLVHPAPEVTVDRRYSVSGTSRERVLDGTNGRPKTRVEVALVPH